MITVFASPKPFRGRIAVIQRNAIESWIRLHAESQVILFGDEEGVAQVAEEFGIHHVPEVARNEYGTPLLNDIFYKAEKLARHKFLCYCNCDIILMSDFMRAVKSLYEHKRRFLMIGECWKVEDIGSLDVNNWEERLKDLVLRKGKRRGPWALDYFVMTRGLYEAIPPFALGRAYFDNWLVWKGQAMNSAVDASSVVTAIHQNHDYSHVRGGIDWVYRGEEAMRNLKLAGGKVANVFDSTFRLTPHGLRLNWKGHFPIQPLRHMGWPIQSALTQSWLGALKTTKRLRHSIGLNIATLERLRLLFSRLK